MAQERIQSPRFQHRARTQIELSGQTEPSSLGHMQEGGPAKRHTSPWNYAVESHGHVGATPNSGKGLGEFSTEEEEVLEEKLHHTRGACDENTEPQKVWRAPAQQEKMQQGHR